MAMALPAGELHEGSRPISEAAAGASWMRSLAVGGAIAQFAMQDT